MLPPKLAALLTVGFILWLFRRLSKQSIPMSFGMWVAFTWLAIIGSRPMGYWFASGDVATVADPLGGSFVDRNTYLFLIILGLFALVRRRVDWRDFVSRSRWLWIFYLYLLFSVFWSDFPFIAFKRWFKDFGNVVMIMVILTEEDPLEAVRSVLLRMAYVLVTVSVLVIKWFPDIGRYYHKWTWTTCYCGITTNKNALGDAAMIGGLVLLWNIVDFGGYPRGGGKFKDNWPDLLIFGMCLWLLHKAQSATSAACLMLGALVFFAARLAWARNNIGRLAWCGLGVVLVMLAFTVLPGFRGVVAGVLGRDVTLTGRTDIWEAALKLPTNPLLGHGFDSTWLSPKGHALSEELGIPHAHNGYLETYLNSGMIGVTLLLAVLLSAGRNVRTLLMEGGVAGYFFMAAFLSGVLYNYTEVAFNHGNIVGFLMWLLAALGGVSLAGNRQQDGEHDSPALVEEPPFVSAEMPVPRKL
jgi:exopolysaccharide production protein ExoQ